MKNAKYLIVMIIEIVTILALMLTMINLITHQAIYTWDPSDPYIYYFAKPCGFVAIGGMALFMIASEAALDPYDALYKEIWAYYGGDAWDRFTLILFGLTVVLGFLAFCGSLHLIVAPSIAMLTVLLVNDLQDRGPMYTMHRKYDISVIDPQPEVSPEYKKEWQRAIAREYPDSVKYMKNPPEDLLETVEDSPIM